MKIYLLFIQLCYIYQCNSIKIKPELKKNVFKFGHGINLKYEGMSVHSFDRFYVVTKFILPSIGDLNFSKLNYDTTCAYLDVRNTHNADTKKYSAKRLNYICLTIKDKLSHMITAHNTLKNEIYLILPQIYRKQKCGIIYNSFQLHRVSL